MARLVALLTLLVAFAHAPAAGAATFTVNDADDTLPADSCTSPGVPCELRAAVQRANATSGPDEIVIANDVDPTLAIDPAAPFDAASGDLDITESVTIRGASGDLPKISGDAENNDRVFDVAGTATDRIAFRLQNVEVQEGTVPANAHGGAVRLNEATAAIEGVTLRKNGSRVDVNGGAVYIVGDNVDTTPDLTIVDSTLSENEAENGGGIHAVAANVHIEGSTFVLNTADGGGGAWLTGGATQAQIVNSTFFDNRQTSNGGAAIMGNDEADIGLLHVTMAENKSTASGDDGIRLFFGATLTTKASILDDAADMKPFCAPGTTFTSLGDNVGVATNCTMTPPAGESDDRTDPQLGIELADNGGPTRTIAPPTGSPAIDIDIDAETECGPNTARGVRDQRGGLRPRGPGCDAGAVEVGGLAGASVVLTGPTTAAPGTVVEYTADVRNEGPDNAAAPRVDITLPPGAELTGPLDAGPDNCEGLGCTFAPDQPTGPVGTVDIKVRFATAGSYQIKATASNPEQGDETLDDNVGRVTTTVGTTQTGNGEPTDNPTDTGPGGGTKNDPLPPGPIIEPLAPALSGLKATPRRFRVRGVPKRKRGTRVTFMLDRQSPVKLWLRRLRRGKATGRRLGRRTIAGTAGENVVRLRGKGLKRGRYRLYVKPVGGKAVAIRVRVRR